MNVSTYCNYQVIGSTEWQIFKLRANSSLDGLLIYVTLFLVVDERYDDLIRESPNILFYLLSSSINTFEALNPTKLY